MSLEFDTTFVPAHGVPVELEPGVMRVTVNNPGPFTFHGTNSYIVGADTLAVIDPGPDDDAHFDALVAAIAGRPVSHIFVSHTHKDHSPLTDRLKHATGAIVAAEGPHRAARPIRLGEVNPLQESSDTDFEPDLRLADDQMVTGDGWAIRAIHTPGHCANHVSFALEGAGILFSADHVMAWATTIVAPPDGAMTDFMRSLDRLLGREDRIYYPGHGGPVLKPLPFVRALKSHRKMRERAIVERLRKGDRSIAAMVSAIYRDTDPRLRGAAALNVLAQLEDLVSRGVAAVDGEMSIDGIYRLA
jgi:glyoxylase-like metal-dependent hydrolase (beta-lactamase superfamily II)